MQDRHYEAIYAHKHTETIHNNCKGVKQIITTTTTGI